MFVGRRDTLVLLLTFTGLFTAWPWMAGSTLIYPLLMLSGLSVVALTVMKFNDGALFFSAEKEELKDVIASDLNFPREHNKEGFIVGYRNDNRAAVEISNSQLVRHTAIIGQSGVGKTTLAEFMLWQQMVKGGGWIFIDAKIDGETRDRMAYMARVLGRSSDFYVLNVNEPEYSHTYNPILRGDADEVASRILNLIPSTDSDAGADHYKQSANHALTALIGAIKSIGKSYTISDLALLMQSGAALNNLESMMTDTPEAKALRIFLSQFKGNNKNGSLDMRRMKDVLGGISGRLAVFSQGKFGEIFNTNYPDIDLLDIINGNKFLYVMLPTMGKDTAALNLGKMVLSDLRSAISEIQGYAKCDRPDPAFMVVADEMGAYATEGLARLFEQARSANIAMVPAFQSFSQLDKVSPDFSDILIQNTWNKVFFKFGSKESPEIAAEIIGKTTKIQRSISMSENESNSSQSLRTTPESSDGDSLSVSQSWRQEKDFRVSPDRLRSLEVGEAIAVIGDRLFHVTTPMLNFPEDLPNCELIRFEKESETDSRCLGFYERFSV